MKVSKINFSGKYVESVSSKLKDDTVIQELDAARPYLKLMARCMPGNNDVFVKVKDDFGDTVINVNYVDNKTNEVHTLTSGTEHTLSGHGQWLMSDTFKGLEKYNPEIFADTAKAFVKHLDFVQYEQHPIKYDDGYEYLDCGCVIKKCKKLASEIKKDD